MSAADTETYTDRTDRRRVGSFVGFVLSRLGPRALQLVGGTFLTLLVIPVVYAVLDRKTYPQHEAQPATPAEAPAAG